MKKQAFSTIPIEKQKTTTLQKNEKGNLLSDMTEENGMIESILNIEVVDEILSTSIYDKPEVAIREVFNNALRQCRTAEKEGATPQINIIFDVKNNRLVFEELDSMGMTVNTFKEVYRHTGRSGNLDGSESGQFGIGKKSFRAIADSMIFETFARETNEKYAFMAKGSKFEELPEPNLKQFGSRVSFAIKKGVNLAHLAKYVSKIARFTQVKTYLQISDDLKENPNHTSIAFEKGITQIGPIVPKEFLAKKLDTEIENIEWIELDKPDYYLLMAFGNSRSEAPIYNNLVGIPISLGETEETEHERLQQNKIPDPNFSGYILNIKNERKYPPVASRDNLKQDSFDKLEKVIRKDLEEFFSKIDVKTIHDYKASSQKYFIDNLPYGGFQEVMPRSTINFNKLLSLKVETFDNEEKHDDGRYYRVDLDQLFKKNMQVLCNYNKTMRRINKVLEFSSKVVVLVPEGNKHDRHSSLWIMEQAGIQTISDFMKAKNIKLPKNSAIGEVAVRFGGYSNGVEQMDLDDLTQYCIRIPKDYLIETNIREFCDVLRDSEFTKFGMFRDQKKFEDTASITLSEFLRDIQKETFGTNEGLLKGKEILDSYKNIVILRAHESKFENQIDFEFVKKETESDLVIVELPHKDNNPTKVQALMLVSRIIKDNEWKKVGDDLDNIIASKLVEPLKIDFVGSWEKSPEMAIKYLGEIKNLAVREVYALAYSEIFEYGDGWTSKDKKDIQTCKELHELFTSLPDKPKMELCHILYEKFEDAKYDSYQRTIEEMTKKIVFEGLKKIDNLVERYTQVVNLFLKDNIENLKVRVPKSDSSRDDIIITFVCNRKITIGEELLELIREVSKGYPSLKSVNIDGNKFEVLFH